MEKNIGTPKAYTASDFNNISEKNDVLIRTGNEKFDVWSSRDIGQVRGTVTFVTGTSGAGKTTLMMNIMEWYKDYVSSLYSREMKVKRVVNQVRNLLTHNNAYLSGRANIPTFDDYMVYLNELKPTIVIVDSLQAIAKQDYPEMSEDAACEKIRTLLTQYTEDNNAVCYLIGHNTKEGEFAGKNTNMQMVDAHMVLEKNNKTGIRKMYFGQKNRNGEDGTLYYEIQDGKIVFFTEEEYADKLNPTEGPVSLLKQVTQMIKSYEKSVKNDLFQQELASGHKLYKQINKNNNVQYIADMFTLTTNLLNKYGIKQ